MVLNMFGKYPMRNKWEVSCSSCECEEEAYSCKKSIDISAIFTFTKNVFNCPDTTQTTRKGLNSWNKVALIVVVVLVALVVYIYYDEKL